MSTLMPKIHEIIKWRQQYQLYQLLPVQEISRLPEDEQDYGLLTLRSKPLETLPKAKKRKRGDNFQRGDVYILGSQMLNAANGN
jgi:hypothetical protein